MVFWKRKIIYSFMISKLSSVQWSFGKENYLCPHGYQTNPGSKKYFLERIPLGPFLKIVHV
ncbi:hypothetical protein [Cedratvirus kamchatka]|uniref:Uncharacterized protein n=1 Tax=Cedratvirus kamchatka TaxID=2716914 RepID=A0A6G8MX12_9VIRU|nr:hypothetical protein [Cedratvirus kamchatka]